MTAWFANLGVSAKSSLAPALAILGLVCVATGAVLVFGQLTQDFRSLNEASFVRYVDATELDRAVLRVNADLYAISSLAANSSETTQVATRIATVLRTIDALMLEAATTAGFADTPDGGQAIAGTLAAYAKSARDMLDMTLMDAGMALMLMGAVQDNFGKLNGMLGALVTAADQNRSATYKSALASIDFARLGMIAAALLATLLAVLAATITTRSVSRPIVALTAVMKRVADGVTDVVIPGGERHNELGAMARALEVFKTSANERDQLVREQETEHAARLSRTRALEARVQQFEREVASILASFAAAAAELDLAARSMSARAANTAEQSTAVLAVVNQTSTDVATITTAAGQLSASIADIVVHVARSSLVAESAVDHARRTNETVEGLAAAAQKIGRVVTLIQTISAQTNLLALNATIEAARAGEHGKGFAVVAAEVKNLANQTARATDEISSQIVAIQSANGAAVEAIRGIGATITEISQISATIAAAVAQQGAATRAIAGNVHHAAAGTQAMSASMSGMNRASEEVGAAASHVLHQAEQLSGKSATLKERVELFLAAVAAA